MDQRLIDLVLDLHSTPLHYDCIAVFDENQEIAVLGVEELSHRFGHGDLEFPRNN